MADLLDNPSGNRDSGDSTKRLLMVMVITMGAVAVMNYLNPTKPPEGPAGPDAGLLAVAPDAGEQAQGDGGALVPQLAAGSPEPVELPPVRELEVRRPPLHLVFSSQGAGLTSAQLQGPKAREQVEISMLEGFGLLGGRKVADAPQVDMAVKSAGKPLPLSVRVDGAMPLGADARYALDDSTPGQLVFTAKQGPWELKKKLTFDPQAATGAAAYLMQMEVQLTNVGAQSAAGELVYHWSRGIDPGSEFPSSFFGRIGNQSRVACAVADKYEFQLPDDEKPTGEHKGKLHFVGIDQQYFLAALYPLDEVREGRCSIVATTTLRSVEAAYPVAVAPGQSLTQRFGVYVGPKDVELLAGIAGVPEDGKAATARLEYAVDFGIWAVICKVLLLTLKFFHGLAGNWGVAIILLTVVVKLLLMPLTYRQMISAEGLRKLQPRVEEIRKKYPDDRERQNVETMKLYQEAKVSPFGGCLPVLLQFPIWAALFTTLRTSYEIYGEPFFGPIWFDLTYKDPTYVLPVLLGVTMIITQRLQPQMMDPMQAKMFTYVMPVFFTAIMLNYPAGLTLYIFTNNLLSIGQQFLLKRYLERKGVANPAQVAKRT